MKNFGKLAQTTETVSIVVSPERTTDVPPIFDQEGNLVTPGRTETIPEVREVKQIIVLRNADGVEWHELFKQFPHAWYIAVMDDGRIISMESDPEQSQIAECTLWGIDSNFGFTRGTGGTVYGKIWDGTKIEPRPVLPQNSPLSPDKFYGWLDGLGELDAFTAAIEQVTPVAKKLTCRNQFNNSTSFAWDMVLMTLVAPLVWDANWQEQVSGSWVAASQA